MGNKGGRGKGSSSAPASDTPSKSTSRPAVAKTPVKQPTSDVAVDAQRRPKKELLSELHKKSGLTDQQREDRITVLFNKYDTDHSGELDMQEFKLFAKDWFDSIFQSGGGGDQSFEEFWEDIQLEIDLDGSGTISLSEFIQWLK